MNGRDTKLDNVLGDNVQSTRRKADLTRVELARRIGMRESFIAKLEYGNLDYKIPGDVLFRIARELGTTIADLYNLPVRVRVDDKTVGGSTKLPKCPSIFGKSDNVGGK